jgi:hypothetical protein
MGIGEPTNLMNALGDLGEEAWKQIRRWKFRHNQEVWAPLIKSSNYIPVGVGLTIECTF